uniref:Predicted protein n=1 Tax=Hordeum vulgare subsp. vulgare TaxID=112509 RepID=F2E209_HORVV|nr:predicted protein [Hordeum vulgare subsp. vulgare]
MYQPCEALGIEPIRSSINALAAPIKGPRVPSFIQPARTTSCRS